MSSQSGLSHVYVGAARWMGGTLGGLFRQTVGQDGWDLLRKGLPEPTEVQAITVHPDNPDVLFVGTQDGPYRSTDRGESWERLDFPDEGRQVWSILVHPRDGRVLYAGTSPVGVYRSDNGGDTWTRLPVTYTERIAMPFACRVMRLAVDPGPPDAVYAGLEVGGAMRSVDGGETWQDCGAHLVKLAERQHLKNCILTDNEAEGMLDAHAVAVSAAAPGSAFLAVRTGLFRTDDRGETWTDLEVGRFSPLTYSRDIRVSLQDARTLYACLSPASQSQNGSVYRSQDLGRTWARFDHGVTPRTTMMGVALHPRDAGQVYAVARRGQVFGTQDGGRTWRESLLPEEVKDCYAIACG